MKSRVGEKITDKNEASDRLVITTKPSFHNGLTTHLPWADKSVSKCRRLFAGEESSASNQTFQIVGVLLGCWLPSKTSERPGWSALFV